MPCSDCTEVKVELAVLKAAVTEWFQVLLKEIQSSKNETLKVLEKLERFESVRNGENTPRTSVSGWGNLVEQEYPAVGERFSDKFGLSSFESEDHNGVEVSPTTSGAIIKEEVDMIGTDSEILSAVSLLTGTYSATSPSPSSQDSSLGQFDHTSYEQIRAPVCKVRYIYKLVCRKCCLSLKI